MLKFVNLESGASVLGLPVLDDGPDVVVIHGLLGAVTLPLFIRHFDQIKHQNIGHGN